MSVKLDIRIDSAKLQKYLANATPKVERALQTAITKGTITAQGLARRASPVDTGRLRSSIFYEIRPLFGSISTDTEYAVYVHDGTRHITGRPFMKEAADQVAGQLDAIIDSEVSAAID